VAQGQTILILVAIQFGIQIQLDSDQRILLKGHIRSVVCVRWQLVLLC